MYILVYSKLIKHFIKTSSTSPKFALIVTLPYTPQYIVRWCHRQRARATAAAVPRAATRRLHQISDVAAAPVHSKQNLHVPEGPCTNLSGVFFVNRLHHSVTARPL